MRYNSISCAIALALVAISSPCAIAQTDSAPAGGAGVIHLHMPGAGTSDNTAIHLHPIRHHGAAPAALPDTDAAGPSAASEMTPPALPAGRHKTSKGTNDSGKVAIPFNFGEDEPSPPQAPSQEAAPAAAPPSLKTASIPPHAGPPSPHTAAPQDEHAGLTKRGAVMFEKGSTNPSPAQFSGVKILAGDLATALESGASRIQLEAYGGAPGDKSSDARRLSLKRALAVRQLLIDNGVPSNRIDVRAMGGVDDKGPTDRVDVFVRAG